MKESLRFSRIWGLFHGNDALKYGNRLIMFAHGKIVLDVSGKEKEKMSVNDLYNLFQVQNEM